MSTYGFWVIFWLLPPNCKLWWTRLSSTHLDSARLCSTQLDSAQISSTQLDLARLSSTQLDSARLSSTQLNSAQLSSTQLVSAQLSLTQHNSFNYRLLPPFTECCRSLLKKFRSAIVWHFIVSHDDDLWSQLLFLEVANLHSLLRLWLPCCVQNTHGK